MRFPRPRFPLPFVRRAWNWTFLLALGTAFPTVAQDALTGATQFRPNLIGQTERPLRYRPEGSDFVIENGAEYFNRPLYGGNTAFRVDAGDKPEFSLYLPGRGGNLRLGLAWGDEAKWLNDADSIVARYRPGGMVYVIRDSILGQNGNLELSAYALHETEGLIVRVHVSGVHPGLELVWGYGGANGQRGVRDGDIGTERVPISQYFQLQPEFCQDNRFTLKRDSFTLHSGVATIVGSVPDGSRLAVGDANQWNSCNDLLRHASDRAEPATPVLVGRVALVPGAPLHLALQRTGGAARTEELSTYRDVSTQPGTSATSALLPVYAAGALPDVFKATKRHFVLLRNRVKIETPDPYLDAAVGALNVAADAVWDEPQGAVMHGAIAWRSRLLGWRGPYAMSALGWHDRARRHLGYWATRQNLDPIPDRFPPPEEETNLARSRTALHSHGNLSNSHYDMNTVYIDALLRHLLWTGDMAFAREVWPVIENHLAWERRLFRREFAANGETLPLYEAYAVIWASDDIQYHGGGVAYSSAYNEYHNRLAARLAVRLGHDPSPYEREAELIARGLRTHLWMEPEGAFAEFKDLLGRQLLHRSPGLWSVYHVIDSETATAAEAWRMTAFAGRHFPLLPVHGPNVPDDLPHGIFSSTDWMPYSWSVNNVVFGENLHTALAFWQAGRADDAYRLTRSALLAAMYMGICPGNVGSMSYLDVYRREAQRDFADGSGVLARALMEGLFGLRPDALAGEIVIAPGLPPSWEHARLQHPDITLAYWQNGDTQTFTIELRFGRPMPVTLRVPAAGRDPLVRVDGTPAEWRWIDRGPAPALLEVRTPATGRVEVRITWRGATVDPPVPLLAAQTVAAAPTGAPAYLAPLPRPAVVEPVNLDPYFNDRVTQIFRNEYRSPRSPFVSLAQPKQGIGAWAGHVNATAGIDDTGFRARAAEHGGHLPLPNGVRFATPGPGEAANVLFTSQWDNYPTEAAVPLQGRARQVVLLMAGSTNWMQSRMENGEIVVRYTDGSDTRLGLHNPTNWWPIEQDYFIDDYQFRRPEPIPPRVNLKTGEVRLLDVREFKGRGGRVEGGAATVLELSLDPTKELESLTVRAITNEVIIGLMAATLVR